jgi:metallo-beta-lactamase family protein
MEIKLSFLGAAQNVTGSRHLVEANGVRFMVDCGLYQERQFQDRNWKPFPVEPPSIDAIILTHAHLDHCGYLPRLVRDGFKGKIYCTGATAEIAKIILLDSAKIQEEDAEYKEKRLKKQGREGRFPPRPLYTVEDAEACFPLFAPFSYRERFEIGEGVVATLYDAGHVLGSAIVRTRIHQGDENRVILFSGDIGRPDRPIVCDPTIFDAADYVLIESTYGDREHEDTEDIKNKIGRLIRETQEAGGRIVVPSFALERSQEVLYYINELLLEKQIAPVKIFLDSPMASRITEVFKQHPELFDEEMSQFVKRRQSPFNIPGLEMAGSAKESRAIKDATGSVMIIAGSGMCTGGRVKYHLVNYIEDPKNLIMFVGYQAQGTLGRRIVDGDEQVRILGEMYNVRARVERIHGFSAHADSSELLDWLRELDVAPRRVFIVHGESDSAKAFGDQVREKTGWEVSVPEYNEQIVVD